MFEENPNLTIFLLKLVNCQFVSLDAARNLDVDVPPKDAAQDDRRHTPETYRYQSSKLERGMIKNENRPDKAEKHMKFKIGLDLPQIGEDPNSLARRINDNASGDHQGTDNPIPVPP